MGGWLENQTMKIRSWGEGLFMKHTIFMRCSHGTSNLVERERECPTEVMNQTPEPKFI